MGKSAEAKPEKTSALALLDALSLDQVREEMARIEEQISGLKKTIDSLRVLERAIVFKTEGHPLRRAKRGRKAADDSDFDSDSDGGQSDKSGGGGASRKGPEPSTEIVELRDKIAAVIQRRGEAFSVSALTRVIGAEYGKIDRAVRFDSRFVKTEAGWDLVGRT